MSEKKPFALRIDTETMKAIEKWAADEFRSTNGQIEWVLSEALRRAGRVKGKGEGNLKVESGELKVDRKGKGS